MRSQRPRRWSRLPRRRPARLRPHVFVAVARNKINYVLEPIRVTEWWEHKLAPMLGTGYMTAFDLRSSLLDIWPTFVAALAGVAVAAAYVSLLNDVTDVEDDAAAGKYNRIAQRG